jgi:hypothetical protein
LCTDTVEKMSLENETVQCGGASTTTSAWPTNIKAAFYKLFVDEFPASSDDDEKNEATIPLVSNEEVPLTEKTWQVGDLIQDDDDIKLYRKAKANHTKTLSICKKCTFDFLYDYGFDAESTHECKTCLNLYCIHMVIYENNTKAFICTHCEI